jgi:nucleoside diphosphate kinase
LFFPYSGTAALNPASARPVEKTVAIIKPDIVKTDRVEQLVKVIKIHGLEVISTREVTFTPEKVAEFYKEHVSKPYFRNLVDFLTSAPAIVLILEGPDAIIKWRTLMGPGDSEKAREMAPNSIRALFGSNVLENAVYGSDSAIIASRDIDLFFNDGTAAKAAEEQERERLAAETAAQVSKLEEKVFNPRRRVIVNNI